MGYHSFLNTMALWRETLTQYLRRVGSASEY